MVDEKVYEIASERKASDFCIRVTNEWMIIGLGRWTSQQHAVAQV